MTNHEDAHDCVRAEIVDDAVIPDAQFEQAFEIPFKRF